MALRHCLLLALILGGLSGPASEAAGRTLMLGFTDPVFTDTTAAPAWLGRVTESAGEIVRLDEQWFTLAPKRPLDPASPADPAYRWDRLDQAARLASAAGLQIGITIEYAPTWAEGPSRPRSAARGTWKPDPSEFGHLGRALARRYDGTFPDPKALGQSLPRVKYFQAWNEPNLSHHYTPQWVAARRGFRQYSPSGYRALLNAFYDGVKASQPDAKVVAAGLGPFGDPISNGQRIPPAAFWRTVFCFRNAKLATVDCPSPAKFDILDHHPYSVGPPERKALNPDDVTIPDLHKIVRPLRQAERKGLVLPKGQHRLWASEISWDSSPPDPEGVPDRTRALWIPRTFEILWSAGVDSIFWFLIRDMEPTPSFAATYQSGMYLHDGTAKASQAAFRFAVSKTYKNGKRRVWARLPGTGTLTIERRAGAAWRVMSRTTGTLGVVVRRSFAMARSTPVRVRFAAN